MPTRVFFGVDEASDVVVADANNLTCTSPAHSGGAAEEVDITVETSAGTSPIDPADTFAYTTPAAVPTVASVAPNVGTTAGGITTTIHGTDLDTVIAILFGDVPADMSTVAIISSGQITVTVPPAAVVGSVDVVVSNPAGDSPISGADTFAYTSQPPVITILGITLADGSLVTGAALTAAPIACSGTIKVAWSATDDIDTVLPQNYLARWHGPKIADGIPVFGNYACPFNTAVLGDGTHQIEADGVDSDFNLGRSSDTQGPVTLHVDNGGSATSSGITNPDFRHLAPVGDVLNAVAPHLADAAAQAAMQTAAAHLDANALHLEDYVNRNVVRRHTNATRLGDGSDHTDTGWVDVAPLIQLQVLKASPRSRFMCTVMCSGVGIASGDWVEFGVHIEGPGGYDLDQQIARSPLITGVVHAHGARPAAADASAGLYTATLRVRLDTGGHWVTNQNATLSLVVIEVPLNG